MSIRAASATSGTQAVRRKKQSRAGTAVRKKRRVKSKGDRVRVSRREKKPTRTKGLGKGLAQNFGAKKTRRVGDLGPKVPGRFTNPVPGARFTSGFGPRKAPTPGASTFHKGIDLAAPIGTKVGATRGGVVTRSGFDRKGYGNWVEVRHPDGTSSRYGHLDKRGVKVGQEVEQGARLGTVGNSGRSTGPHLHFEIRDAQGRPVDPMKYI
ncbi:M23 family metallopeptidase [bacterium]|nr:M23 family metallopeptidase [bacterium]